MSEGLTIGGLRHLDLESYKDVNRDIFVLIILLIFFFQALTNSVSFFTIMQAMYSDEEK